MPGPRRPNPRSAVRHFESRFARLGNPARAVQERAYMKSSLRFHGIDAKTLRAECAAFCKEHPDLDRASLVAIVNALFASDWFDLRSAAIALLERRWKLLDPTDAPWLVELARKGACWAHVDYLVTQVLEPLLEDDKALPRHVRRWAKDDDFWVRRVALLAQLRALRHGGGDFELFAEIAAPMLPEKEFFVRKAIGWVLREVSKKRPVLVHGFLRVHGEHASGVTWREATKYLPAKMKRELDGRRAR